MSRKGVTIGIDIGTTAVKAVAADEDGRVVARARIPHELRVPAPDRLEHNADEAWRLGPLKALEQLARPDALAVAVSAMVPSLTAARPRPSRHARRLGPQPWMQAIADATARPLQLSGVAEGAALGAAFLGRMAVGEESAFTDAARWAATERVVEPSPAWVAPVQERYHRFLELASLR